MMNGTECACYAKTSEVQCPGLGDHTTLKNSAPLVYNRHGITMHKAQCDFMFMSLDFSLASTSLTINSGQGLSKHAARAEHLQGS